MSLTQEQITGVQQALKKSLRHKFEHYAPEPASMPFHTRLLGKDRLALYSFIHSLNSSFGTAFFEPVAEVIAKQNFKTAKVHTTAGEFIFQGALDEIDSIMRNLSISATSVDKKEEIAKIRAVCQVGIKQKVKPTLVDLFVESNSGELYLFDLKTAKPNAGNFKEFKRTLLEWAAAILAADPKANVNTLISIPYNPYEPEPYNRWTMRGMLDLKLELKVANEFWDFLGGDGTYEVLLDCFEQVGIELREEIDNYFTKFQANH